MSSVLGGENVASIEVFISFIDENLKEEFAKIELKQVGSRRHVKDDLNMNN